MPVGSLKRAPLRAAAHTEYTRPAAPSSSLPPLTSSLGMGHA